MSINVCHTALRVSRASLVAIFAWLVAVPSHLAAQATKADSAAALAKASQNPLASLISLPFQFNFNSGGGLEGKTSLTVNFQPVIPIKGVLKNWTIIARTIVPYLSTPAGATRQSGFADIQQQLFFTPAKSGSVIWGIGPLFSFPTATTDAGATGSWAIGPAGVVLSNQGPFVLGALVTNLTTFADDGEAPEVNQFLLQPFINYNFGGGWAASFVPNITANWDAPDGEQWTVPLGIGVSKTTAFNSRPMTLGMNYYHNVEHPTAGPANRFQMSIALLYPSRPKPAPAP
jgi:hypothetical protein